MHTDDTVSSLPPAVQRLRRLQIRQVAFGTMGGLAFLIGLAIRQPALAWAGVAVFAVSLLAVFVLGFAAARSLRRHREVQRPS